MQLQILKQKKYSIYGNITNNTALLSRAIDRYRAEYCIQTWWSYHKRITDMIEETSCVSIVWILVE